VGDDGATVLTNHESDVGTWETAWRPAHPTQAAYVSGYSGFWGDVTHAVDRLRYGRGTVPLVLSFGPPIDIVSMPDPGWTPRSFTSFVCGPQVGPTLTRYRGLQYGIGVDLTPIGAYLLLGGLPLRQLAGNVVDLTDLPGAMDDLVGRLAEAATWQRRFALLDTFFAGRLAESPRLAGELTWAWGELRRTGGQVRVGELVERIGWSSRHFAARFEDVFGLAPKAVARVLRFDRARRLLLSPAAPPLSELAVTCGYYDQSHFIREFKALCGRSPGAYRAAQLPGAGGQIYPIGWRSRPASVGVHQPSGRVRT
jgi:AraC-like DNA-binding protein